MIGDDVYGVDPWTVPEKALQLDLLRADRVDLRALQRPHRAARQPRRGRAVGPLGDVPQRLLRDPAAALRRGRLRRSGVRRDDDQRHERQGPAPARRRRAVRPALRHRRAPHAHARPARRRPAPRGALALARRPGGDPAHDAAGLLRPARGRGHRLRGRGVRRAGADRRAVRAHRQRAGARDDERPARRGRAAQAAAGRVERPSQAAGGPRAPHARLEAARRGRDGPHRRPVRRRSSPAPRARRTSRA